MAWKRRLVGVGGLSSCTEGKMLAEPLWPRELGNLRGHILPGNQKGHFARTLFQRVISHNYLSEGVGGVRWSVGSTL